MAARAALFLIAALAAAACARDDAGRRHLSLPGQALESATSERERGFALDREIQATLPMIRDLEVLETLDALAAPLVERLGEGAFDVRLRIVVHPELNAFAIPGGYVYLHTGTILAAGDAEELAGVLAHELGHVKGRHQARLAKETAIPSLLAQAAGVAVAVAAQNAGPMLAAQAANVAIQLQYTRRFEDEADRLAMVFLTRAGFGSEGLVRFFERVRLEQDRLPEGTIPPYLFSHPQVDERIALVRELARELRPRADPPAQDEGLAVAQGRIAWLAASGREAMPATPPADRAVAAPALAEATRLREAGRSAEAFEALAAAERAAPEDPRVPLRRAEWLAADGRQDESIAAYRRTVALDPSATAVLLALGRAYRDAGDVRRALLVLEHASWRAGESGRARARIDAEIERLVFPMIVDSGFAAGPAASEPSTALGTRAEALPAGERDVAWWGRLGVHWLDRARWLRVRWVDPSGARGAPATLARDGVHLVAVHRLPRDAAPGPWTAELLFGDDVVHAARIERVP